MFALLGSYYVVIGWCVRLLMIPVVASRHRPYVALAWLGPIFLFPVLGSLVYLWLGHYGLTRSADRHRRVRAEIEADDPLRRQRQHPPRHGADPEHRDLARLGESLSTAAVGGFPILGGNAAELLRTEDSPLDRIIADIEGAEHHVHLLFYMYIDDAAGRRTAEALARAVGRGVACRVLVDSYASGDALKTLGPWMRARGIEVRTMLDAHPLRRPLARMDLRNHRKMAVLDGRVGHTGSTNVHEPGHGLDEGVWHQISIRLVGPAVLQLQMVFVEDWFFATESLLRGEQIFPEPRREGDLVVQAIPGGPTYPLDTIQHLYVQAIAEANRRLVITTPYFVPDEATQVALRLAALRGVEVDLVVARRSDSRIADIAGRSYFQDLMEVGVRIHRHPHGILHAKSITVDDDVSLVGTANFDRRSFFLNYELVLVLYSEDLTRRLRRMQERYLREAHRVDSERWRERPRRTRLLEDLVKLLSPVA